MTLRVHALAATLAMTVAGVTLAPTAFAGAANNEVTSSGASVAQCQETEWTQYGNYITEETSPWFNSVRGIDFSRKIQFRVLSGIYAKRISGACVEQRASFAGASHYREEQCNRPGVCKLTGWLTYGDDVERPGFRFPNQNAGFDPHADLFHTWEAPCCPPWS